MPWLKDGWRAILAGQEPLDAILGGPEPLDGLENVGVQPDSGDRTLLGPCMCECSGILAVYTCPH